MIAEAPANVQLLVVIVTGLIAVATAATGIISRSQIQSAKANTALVSVRADELEKQLVAATVRIVHLEAEVQLLREGIVEKLGVDIAQRVMLELGPLLRGDASHG